MSNVQHSTKHKIAGLGVRVLEPPSPALARLTCDILTNPMWKFTLPLPQYSYQAWHQGLCALYQMALRPGLMDGPDNDGGLGNSRQLIQGRSRTRGWWYPGTADPADGEPWEWQTWHYWRMLLPHVFHIPLPYTTNYMTPHSALLHPSLPSHGATQKGHLSDV